VLLGCNEKHSFIEGYLGFGAAVYGIGLLAVDAYRRYGAVNAFLIQTGQYIIETHRLAGVLLQPYNRQAAVFQYFVQEWHCLPNDE